jgi:hypothetical protein
MRNDEGAAFTSVAIPQPDGTSSTEAAAWVDFDNDADLDLYVADSFESYLFENVGGGVFSTTPRGLMADAQRSRGVAWEDVDNDGDQDALVVRGGLLINGGGEFALDETPLVGALNSHAAAFADYDGDGDVDVFIAEIGAQDRLWRNEHMQKVGNHWFHARLLGTTSNRMAIGARVTARAGSLRMMREITAGSGWTSQSMPLAMFGLEQAAAVDSVIIRWPSGLVETFLDPPIDGVVTFIEGAAPVGVVPAARTAACALHGCAPNPMRSAARVRFELASPAPVVLSIHDVSGRLVRVLVRSGAHPAGLHEAAWEGRDERGEAVPSGTYFLCLAAGADRRTKRFTLLR